MSAHGIHIKGGPKRKRGTGYGRNSMQSISWSFQHHYQRTQRKQVHFTINRFSCFAVQSIITLPSTSNESKIKSINSHWPRQQVWDHYQCYYQSARQSWQIKGWSDLHIRWYHLRIGCNLRMSDAGLDHCKRSEKSVGWDMSLVLCQIWLRVYCALWFGLYPCYQFPVTEVGFKPL